MTSQIPFVFSINMYEQVLKCIKHAFWNVGYAISRSGRYQVPHEDEAVDRGPSRVTQDLARLRV